MRTAISSAVVESRRAVSHRAHRAAHIRRANRFTGRVRLSVEELLPGTQLIVRRLGYWHHGIYVGNGQVIQYAGWFRSADGLIEEVPLKRRRLLRPRSSSGARCRNCEPIRGGANQPVCSSLLAACIRTNKGRTHEDCLG